MIVSVRSLPPQAFFSIATGPPHYPLTPMSRILRHTDLSSTIIDGRIPAASCALSIPSKILTTIVATAGEDVPQENRRKNTSIRSRRFPARTERREAEGIPRKRKGRIGRGGGPRKIAEKRWSGRFLAENMIPFRHETLIENPSIRRVSFSFFPPTYLFPLEEKRFLGARCAWSW